MAKTPAILLMDLSSCSRESPCILWHMAKDRDGYGLTTIDGKSRRAHRVTYEMVRGPIPDGLVIDHLCRVRGCINPWHLEAVSNRTNLLRGYGPSAICAKKTHCKRGHELTGDNVYMTGRRRSCRACRKACYARWRAENRDRCREACRNWYHRNKDSRARQLSNQRQQAPSPRTQQTSATH